MKRTIIQAGLSLMLIGAAGCASLGRSAFASPLVELKDVRMRGVGTQGGSLDVVLDVYNPNNFRLDATKLTYRLFVDTLQVATGEIDKLVTLEEHKKNTVIVPVRFSFQEMLGAAQVLSRMGSVDYKIAGEVTVGTPVGNFTRPYQGQGRFDSLRR